METEIKSSYLLARELEGRFKVVNYAVVCGGFGQALGMGQSHNPVYSTISQQYLDLLPLISAIAAKIDNELEVARAKPVEEL